MGSESRRRAAIAGLIAIYFAATLAIAVSKPLRLDEVGTIGIATIPSLSQFFAFFAAGQEPHPPLSHLLIRVACSIFGPAELASRVPSILAAFGATAAVYLFLRHRLSTTSALFGAAIVAIGPAFYATEGRGYALLLCCAATASLAWQRRSNPALFACLALAVSTHYYAVFLFPVFVVATFVRDRARARSTYAAILLGGTPLLIYAPWVRTAFRSSLTSWQHNTQNLRQPSAENIGMFLLDITVRLLCPLVILLGAWLLSRRVGATRSSGLSNAELVLACGLVLLPVTLIALTRFSTGAFFTRYAIAWNVGLGILGAACFAKFIPRPSHQRVCLIATLLSPFLFAPIYTAEPRPWPALTAAWRAINVPHLPLVYSDAYYYESIWFYAPPEMKARLVYVHDANAARQTPDPVPEHCVQIHAALFPYGHTPYEAFLRRHQEFLLLSTGDQIHEWLPQRLRAAGYRLQPLQSLEGHTLYRVSAASSSPPPPSTQSQSPHDPRARSIPPG